MIIDTHAHIFPDPIAEKAALSISKFYNIPLRSRNGRLQTLLEVSRAAGIDKTVICSAATTSAQTTSINDFLAQTLLQHPGVLYGIGAMHQDYPDKPGELLRMRKLGLKGVKIHPDIQGVALNDPRYDALFEALQDTGMLLLAHTGDSRYHYSNPPELLDVINRFPKLKIICAHLGCWSNWGEGVQYLAGRENVFVDCSSSLYALSIPKAREIIRAYGAERVLFGTDFPMWVPKEELARLRALDLSSSEMDLILHKNAERLILSQ